MNSHSLLQGIFPNQGLNPGLLHCWRRQWHPTSVLLPGKSHGQRSLVGCSPWGLKESDTTEQLHFHFSLSRFGEGNGNPFQCSCLENPKVGRAWWAAIYEVAQSQTRLKQLSSSSSFCTAGRFFSIWATKEAPGICCCITNDPKTYQLKTINIYYLTVYVDQESGFTLSGCSWRKISHEITISHQILWFHLKVHLQISFPAHLCGSWWALTRRCMDLSAGLIHDIIADFPWDQQPKKEHPRQK